VGSPHPPASAVAFVREVMGLELMATAVAALEERTEGWVAGPQRAALALQGATDIPGFIPAFAGSYRYIADDLAHEVLRQQPEEVRTFLRQTAILDRLCGLLCDAVTGGRDGQAINTTMGTTSDDDRSVTGRTAPSCNLEIGRCL
jgi:LuxR family transcriptional regulator, maltose regulon positive regulatory protein